MSKQNWFKKHEKAAAAGVCAAVIGITGLTGYHLQDVQARTYAWAESRESDRTGQERSEDHVREIRDRIQSLEKYDISYDEAADTVYYDDRKVRWLVDEQDDGLADCLYDEDGEIDVYTERNTSGRLMGVRVASASEFRERSEMYKDIEASKPGQKAIRMYGIEIAPDESAGDVAIDDDVQITVVENNDYMSQYDDLDIAAHEGTAVDERASAREDVILDSGYENDTYYSGADAEKSYAATVEEGNLSGTEYNELYESIGLTWSRKDQCWKYDGEKVKIVYVEDGSYSTWGNVDEDDSICLYITRKNNDSGTITFSVKDMDYDEMCVLFNSRNS
ncbi:MAG: hypothetical protein Q4D16_06730 [Eubacteriales bacterium]|nr:hypothetical protein [Eubacteriales bacterium]